MKNSQLVFGAIDPQRKKFAVTLFLGLLCLVVLASCADEDHKFAEKYMDVKVTAYNAVTWQTKARNPDIAAWGDTLKEGMKAIAVSRDLLKLGLLRGTLVRIEGLDGEYLVLDKMNSRYRKRIDIFMGLDVDSAREWGVQSRRIFWKVERESVFDKRYQYVPTDTVSAQAASRRINSTSV